MMLFVFIWYLLTAPADKLICSLWISQPPTSAALIQSCGTSALSAYRLDVLDIQTRALVCSRPADALATIQGECNLEKLDQYRLQIIEPKHSELVCSLRLVEDRQPTEADVAAQCPSELNAWKSGKLAAKMVSKEQQVQKNDAPKCAAPSLTIGNGLYQQVSSVAGLSTDEPLTWLAGRMIWYGMVKPACGGASGLDANTLAATPCGLLSARSLVTQWQNQFDADIFKAASLAKVPARLLKRMMSVESQFWPLYVGDASETGIMQVSANGADVLLRYDPTLDAAYPSLTMEEQYWRRLDALNKFDCLYCSLDQAVMRTREIIPMYARLLAAYRCRDVEIAPALSGDEAWRQAVMDYNGSSNYLKKIEQ